MNTLKEILAAGDEFAEIMIFNFAEEAIDKLTQKFNGTHLINKHSQAYFFVYNNKLVCFELPLEVNYASTYTKSFSHNPLTFSINTTKDSIRIFDVASGFGTFPTTEERIKLLEEHIRSRSSIPEGD